MGTFYFTCVVFSNWIVHSSDLMEIKSFHNFEFKTAIFKVFKLQVQTWYFHSKIKWKYQILRSIRCIFAKGSSWTYHFWYSCKNYSSVDIYSGRSLLISLRQDFSSSQNFFFWILIVSYIEWIVKISVKHLFGHMTKFSGGVLLVDAGGQILYRNTQNRFTIDQSERSKEHIETRLDQHAQRDISVRSVGAWIQENKFKKGYSLLFITRCEASRSISVDV